MVQTDALVTDVEQSGPFVRVVLSAAKIAGGLSPGRFVLADLGDCLRVLLFPALLEEEAFWVLVPPEHPAAALQPGVSVDLIGPLGRGFEVGETVRRLLLVADVARLPALLPLTRTSRVMRISGLPEPLEVSVALALSAPTAAHLYPVHLLPASLEVHIATADGSAGRAGSVLDLFPDLVRWADCVCIACDPVTHPALAEIVREVRIGPVSGKAKPYPFAQALVVPPVVCGVGACRGCAVSVAEGFKLACTDGPVFDLLELR
jgi:dihydroorotate dehydrogenase electron transfer subunit